jgi:hypothetical protein
VSRRSSHEVYTAIVTSLMSGARTKREITQHAGVCAQATLDVVALLHDRACIYIVDWQQAGGFVPRWVPVYAWQPSIAAYADAAKPVAKGFERVVNSEARAA